MEDTAVRDAAPRMSCAVLASAAWRALKGASQAVCGPRGRSGVSAGSLPGVGSCCSASMWVRRGKVVTVPALVHLCLCMRYRPREKSAVSVCRVKVGSPCPHYECECWCVRRSRATA